MVEEQIMNEDEAYELIEMDFPRIQNDLQKIGCGHQLIDISKFSTLNKLLNWHRGKQINTTDLYMKLTEDWEYLESIGCTRIGTKTKDSHSYRYIFSYRGIVYWLNKFGYLDIDVPPMQIDQQDELDEVPTVIQEVDNDNVFLQELERRWRQYDHRIQEIENQIKELDDELKAYTELRDSAKLLLEVESI